MQTSELLQRDRQVIWHPYMQHKTSMPVAISRGEGAFLYTPEGTKLLDATSSWWVNIHGHNHPHLNAAIARQAEKISQVQFGNCTHEPAVLLAEKLLAIAPSGLSKVFYSDNGSTAVETALKMAMQYWHNQGQKRHVFLTLHNGYHGDTLGAMSTSDVSAFTKPFKPLLFDVLRAHSPYCLHCPVGLKRETCRVDCLNDLEQQLKAQGEKIAAIIVEPMLQGAAGMITWPKEFLAGVKALSKHYNTLLITDEVFAGFGRTGKMFACEHAEVKPDIMCLSKGLTAGYLPMAVTLASEPIFQAFYSDEKAKAFFHGHSFTANPLGCAVALASLELFETGSLLERIARLELLYREILSPLAKHPRVAQLRILGAVAAIELTPDHHNSKGSYLETSGQQLCAELLERGLLMRPLGNVVYFLPPYIITDDDARWALTTLANTISDWQGR